MIVVIKKAGAHTILLVLHRRAGRRYGVGGVGVLDAILFREYESFGS